MEADSYTVDEKSKQGKNHKITNPMMNNPILLILCAIMLYTTQIMSNNILQWNCRGFSANFEEISVLIYRHKPAALCVQETFFSDTNKISLKHHYIYQSNFNGGDKARGGVAIAVNNSVPHCTINVNTSLQATAVSISLNKTITICSVYFPPSIPIDSNKLDELIDQLPKPFILMGDFNAHSSLWGCRDTNVKGRQVEDFICKHDLCLLYDKTYTYLHPATGSYSSLDLTLCSPEVASDFIWRVDDDLHGSDHFPILLSEVGPFIQQHPARRKLHKANWEQFEICCEQSIDLSAFHNSESPAELFTSLIYSAAEKSIPRTSTSPRHPNRPWFN